MSENYFYSSLEGQEIEDTLLGSVVFNKSQSLTTSQKARARANIGAGEGSTSFVVMGFFATLADLQEYLQTLPNVGDAYGISEEPDAASEFLSPDGTQTSFTLSDDARPYALTITEVATGTVLVRGTDYLYGSGVITFPTAPAAGTDSYEVEWYDETSPYHIYVWDGVTSSWIDNGVLIGSEVIDDNDTVTNKTWSSQKISDELAQIDLTALIDDTDTAVDTTWSSNKINTELGTLSSALSSLSDQINTLSTNANTVTIGKVEIFKFDANTLNTPYTEGLSGGSNAGVIISYATSVNNFAQFAMVTGKSAIYTRKKTSGTIGSWGLWGKPYIGSVTACSSISLSGGGDKYDQTATIPTVAGYTPMCVVGWHGGGYYSSHVAVTSCFINSSGKLQYSIKNTSGTTSTYTLTVDILYYPDGA